MNKVLSFRMHRGCDGQSLYVRKSFCISVVFVVGFVSVFGGFTLGRISMQHEYFLKSQLIDYLPRYEIPSSAEISFEMNMLTIDINDLLNITEFVATKNVNNDTMNAVLEALKCNNFLKMNNERLKQDTEEKFYKLNTRWSQIVKNGIAKNVRSYRECFTNIKNVLEHL